MKILDVVSSYHIWILALETKIKMALAVQASLD